MKMPDEEKFVPKFPYREFVGALMYILTCMLSDTAHTASEAAKFCE